MDPVNFCECEQPGICPRYKREMFGRVWEICRGINVDAGTAAAQRAYWLSQAPADAMIPVEKCPHLGAESRDENGKTETQVCVPCGGRTRLKVFACEHPARKPDKVTVSD